MRRLVTALLLACAAATPPPARAGDPSFTPAQRAEIVAVVREALKTDPSILKDAVVALQASEQARQQAEQKTALTDQHKALVADPADPVVGNKGGDVTLVEFYDPRCPYCRRMLPAITSILKKDGKLRLVYKDIPVLGPASVMEVRAILAAQRQGGYERMQTALMTNPAQPSAGMIAETARGLGLDPTKLAADMNSPEISRRIETNMALARALHVDGTPVFVIGGTVIPGAVDQPTLESAVANARSHG